MSTGVSESPHDGASMAGCPKCNDGDYSSSTWCKQCGYYAVLGTCVELDDAYESTDEAGVATSPRSNDWVAAMQAVPSWLWGLGAMLLTIWGLALAFSLNTEPGSAARILGGLAMVVVGTVIGGVAHLYAGIRVLAEEIDFTPADIVASPVRIWTAVLSHMPRTFWRVAFGVCGLWIVLMAHVLVGVPYAQLLADASPTKPQKPKIRPGGMVSAIASAAPKEEMPMEEALDQFAADASQSQDDEPKLDIMTLDEAINALLSGDRDAAEILDVEATGVVMGVTLDEKRRMKSVVIAVQSSGKWQVLGHVQNGLTAAMVRDIASQVNGLLRRTPFVRTSLKAYWLEPEIDCRFRAKYDGARQEFSKVEILGLP